MDRSALDEIPVVVPGHFAVDGIHTETIGVPARYLLHPASLRRAAEAMARQLSPYQPETLVTPAVSGIPLATAVALHLDLPLAIAERDLRTRTFDRIRGAAIGASTAVIDSTYHSGRTLQSMAELVRSFDARIVAATVAVRSRIIGQVTGISPICPVHALHEVDVHAWRPDDCPNCRAGQPLDERPACWKEPR